MAKTKLDRVLEILESQVSQTQAAEGTEPTSEPTVQTATMNETTVSDTEVPTVTSTEVDTGTEQVTDLNVDQLPEKSDNATEAPSQTESDSFDKDFAELAALVGYDVNSKE